MARAKVLMQLVCEECGQPFVQRFNEQKKDFYMVCPASIASGHPCTQSGRKFKVPVNFVDIEEYTE